MMTNARSIVVIVFLMMMSNPLWSQELNRVITDTVNQEDILLGYCNREGLESGNFGKVFKDYYAIYDPDKSVLNSIKGNLDSVRIIIVLGTWCSDSEEQVPKFFKILDKIRFDMKNLTVICVNRAKEAGEIDLKPYDIQRVPTFIVFRGKQDVGRIVESPMMSLEKDLALLLGD